MSQDLNQGAANYVLELNENINQFNTIAGNYCNVIVTAKFFHDFNKDEFDDNEKLVKSIDDNERQTILTTVQQARYFAVQTYLRITALKKTIKQFEKNYKELQKGYEKIVNEPVPTFQSIQEYALVLNKMFATASAQELLKLSSEYYDQIANANTNQ